MTGAYGNDESTGLTGVWNGEKISDEVGNCPHLPNLSKNNAAKENIGSKLKEKGRAAVYGINFDFNSDVSREESKPTLNQIVAVLKENADRKMTVEGHTDSIGGESFNQLCRKNAPNRSRHFSPPELEKPDSIRRVSDFPRRSPTTERNSAERRIAASN